MRKQPKSFTVEVKRRAGAPARKPVLVETPEIGADAVAAAADVLFRSAEMSAEPTVPQSSGRILPCLVTEAALDAAQAEAEVEQAPRRRGRPPKARTPDEGVATAPRKRGRPRKVAVTEALLDLRDDATSLGFVTVAQPYTPSARALGRRSAVAALPRGERWKRRLPKALR